MRSIHVAGSFETDSLDEFVKMLGVFVRILYTAPPNTAPEHQVLRVAGKDSQSKVYYHSKHAHDYLASVSLYSDSGVALTMDRQGDTWTDESYRQLVELILTNVDDQEPKAACDIDEEDGSTGFCYCMEIGSMRSLIITKQWCYYGK